jgi:hypothetical protein
MILSQYSLQTVALIIIVHFVTLSSSAVGEDNPPRSSSPTSLCYSCTYIKSIHDGEVHFQGEASCADPFDGNDIPQIACSGPCAKNILMPKPEEFMVVRSCQPKCRSLARDDGSFIKCCEGKLCNDASSLMYRAKNSNLFWRTLFSATFGVSLLVTLVVSGHF